MDYLAAGREGLRDCQEERAARKARGRAENGLMWVAESIEQRVKSQGLLGEPGATQEVLTDSEDERFIERDQDQPWFTGFRLRFDDLFTVQGNKDSLSRAPAFIRLERELDSLQTENPSRLQRLRRRRARLERIEEQPFNQEDIPG